MLYFGLGRLGVVNSSQTGAFGSDTGVRGAGKSHEYGIPAEVYHFSLQDLQGLQLFLQVKWYTSAGIPCLWLS